MNYIQVDTSDSRLSLSKTTKSSKIKKEDIKRYQFSNIEYSRIYNNWSFPKIIFKSLIRIAEIKALLHFFLNKNL